MVSVENFHAGICLCVNIIQRFVGRVSFWVGNHCPCHQMSRLTIEYSESCTNRAGVCPNPLRTRITHAPPLSAPLVDRGTRPDLRTLPCKSHDHTTGCNPSWDYRGIFPSQLTIKRAVPVAPQTRCGRTLGKEPAAEVANPVGDLSGDTGIRLATISYKLCMTRCLQTMGRFTLNCLICRATTPLNYAPLFQPPCPSAPNQSRET